MTKGVTILAVVANLVVSFYAGRRSWGSLAPYSHADVIAAATQCDAGEFVGGCATCRKCKPWKYDAGGCTYFKDTFCTLCEPIQNCQQLNIRCDNRENEVCLECDEGFWDIDCKPCIVCESGFYESTKCTQDSNTVCTRCTECTQDHYTKVACTYFTDTECKVCTHCNPRNEGGRDPNTDELNEGYTYRLCQLDQLDSRNYEGDRGFKFPKSIYTDADDTICVPCYRPHNNGFQNTEVAVRGGQRDGYPILTYAAGPEWLYDQKDERVTKACDEYNDTKYVECTMCPCANRPTCEYMTKYCTAGDFLETPGDLVECADCTKIRGGQTLKADGVTEEKPFVAGVEWEVFRCGGTSDAVFQDCQICLDGEFEKEACSQTADALCPQCNLDLKYGLLQYCKNTHYTCTNFQDTKCDECHEGWFGETCCYHQYFGSCGTMSTRERIPRRLGYEGETNEEFIDFCLMLCDEFPDCLAFETDDGGISLLGGGMNSFDGKMAKCYFKSAFTQDDKGETVDENGKKGGHTADARKGGGRKESGNALKGRNHVYRGTDPAYDCYSNVCRQNAAFDNAYQTDIEIEDTFDAQIRATDLEGSAYQAGSMTRRLTRGYPGGSSPASRAEYRRMMEKEGMNPGA